MEKQAKKARLIKRVILLMTPVVAVLLIGWGVKTSGYTVKGLYKSFTGDEHIPNTIATKPTIDGMIDTLVMSVNYFEQKGEMQRAIDSLEKAISLKFNQFRLETRLLDMYKKKKELQSEYYAELPALPRNEGCKGARIALIKKIYSIDPDSISVALKKELNECSGK